jgi:enamine deaminase RidA (YjgF/YER057c/UK114 family)
VAAYYAAAKESGEKLTDAQEEQIASTLESLKSSAEQAGESVDKYIEGQIVTFRKARLDYTSGLLSCFIK